MSLDEPELVRVAFGPPPDAEVRVVDAADLVAGVDAFSRTVLPPALAGQPRSPALPGGVAGYGSGLGTLVVLPLPRDLGGSVLRRVRAQPGATLLPDDAQRADVMAGYADAAVGVANGEAWKASVRGAIRPSRGKFSSFTPERQAYVLGRTRRVEAASGGYSGH